MEQDLKDLSAFRSRHINAYKAWSKPKNIALRKERLEAEAPAALAAGVALAALAAAQIKEAEEGPKIEKKPYFNITSIHKEQPNSWFQKICDLFK